MTSFVPIEILEGIVVNVNDVHVGATDPSVFLSELLINKLSKPQLFASTTLIDCVVITAVKVG